MNKSVLFALASALASVAASGDAGVPGVRRPHLRGTSGKESGTMTGLVLAAALSPLIVGELPRLEDANLMLF